MQNTTPMRIAKTGYIILSAVLCIIGISFIAYPETASVLIGMVLNFLTGLPFLIAEHPFSADAQTLGAVLILGIVQLGLAYVFLTKGLEQTPAITASLISGIEPVLNPVLVALFYGEMLGMRLAVMHNLYYYNHLMEDIRNAIDAGEYAQFKKKAIEEMGGDRLKALRAEQHHDDGLDELADPGGERHAERAQGLIGAFDINKYKERNADGG